MKKTILRSLSLILTAALLLCAVPSSVFAQQVEKGELQIGVMTDVHYYAQENVAPGELDAFEKACRATISSSFLADAMINCALDGYRKRAERGELDYLFIPGDLTRNGDLVSARKLAEILEKFEADTGVQVLVADGNHDINNPRAEIFKDGQFIKGQPNMSPADFKEIFKNLGYDLAIDTFTPAEGKVAGCLSYVAQLDKGYRVIMIDGGKYSFDNTDKGLDQQETGGNYTPEVLEWAVNAIGDCVRDGQTPIGMTHWNLVPHFTREINTFVAFPLDNCEEVSEIFADAGMNFVFTGHVHNQDIASHVSDNGNVIYDICTSSLISFPNYVRTVQFDNSDPENLTFDTQTHDFDETKALEWNGKTYDQPFKYECFGINFTGDSAYEMAIRMADYYVNGNLFEEIIENGGLYAFLMGSFDLKSVFDNLLSPITFMGINIFSSQNILALIEDLCKQIDEQYIKDPERVMALAKELVSAIVDYKVSDVPCTKFLDTYGFGSRTEGGTLGELISSVLVYYYTGEQDISDDAFFTDVLQRLETGEVSTGLMNVLIDELVDGLIQKELFGTLKLNLAAAFPRGTFGHLLVFCLDTTLKAMLLGNNTFTNIINKGFGLLNLFKIIDYKSIDDILYHYMDEYLTVSQMEMIDGEIKSFVVSMSTDENPATYTDDGKFLDLECSLSANPNGGYEVEATADNLRLPGLVSVTFGKNACTQKNISWFTKSTVTGTDYQLVTEAEYLSNGFGDKINVRPAGVSVITKHERTTRKIPGIDIGILGFINYQCPVNRHCLYFSGLQPGATYYYRIGDAAKGFWSEPAVIKTADTSDSLTFFHMSDPQCGLERQYQNFAKVVDCAYDLYPDAAFIMCTGDHVDHGDNFNQWKWMFGAARDEIMNTALMPTAGNHEEKGTDAMVNYFTLPDYVQQDTEEGVFYSFDYNNAHFIVLNTNNLSKDKALSDDQLQWLKEDAAGSAADWKIVALHKALYSNGSHYDDDDVVAMRKQLCALMPELGIDVVLQGHDHVYLRTDAMNSNKVAPVYTMADSFEGNDYEAKVNPDGTIYVIDACSGVKYYKTKDSAQTDKLFPRAEKIVNAEDFPVFGAIQIRGSKLYFNAYGVDPETGEPTLIDSFEIIKDSSIKTPKFNDRKTLSDIFSFLKAS